VVVDDFHVPCRAFAPFEANPPLIVDADTLLSAPVTVQSFEAIARRQAQIVELYSGVDGEKLAPHAILNLIRQSLNDVAGKQRRRALVGEALDHSHRAYRKTVRSSSAREDEAGARRLNQEINS
jgi:hypothetical protein